MNYIMDKEKVNSKVYKMIPLDVMDKLKRRDSTIERKDSIILEKSDSIQLVSGIKKDKENQG